MSTPLAGAEMITFFAPASICFLALFAFVNLPDDSSALKKAEVSELEVTHVSTGGGATLKYLAGDEMPGIEALNKIK